MHAPPRPRQKWLPLGGKQFDKKKKKDKKYSFVKKDIDLSTDLLFYGHFAPPRQNFSCPAPPQSKKMLPLASLLFCLI